MARNAGDVGVSGRGMVCGEGGRSGCKAGAWGCVIVCGEDISAENGRAKDISSTGVVNDS